MFLDDLSEIWIGEIWSQSPWFCGFRIRGPYDPSWKAPGEAVFVWKKIGEKFILNPDWW